MSFNQNSKTKKIAVYSEKGGVGKTTILVSLAYKIADIQNSIFLDADASSQSLHDVLKFYEFDPRIVYRNKINILPFLIDIHPSIDYCYIDLAGREASIAEIEYFRYIDLILVPMPPIYSNYSTPVHTVEKLIKNGVEPEKILIAINYMWAADNLDAKIVTEFAQCLELLAKKHNLHYFVSGISFSSNLNRNSSCLKTNSRYTQDIARLAEFVNNILNQKTIK